MKKSFIYALFLGMVVSSCTSEEIVSGGAGTEQEVTMTLNMSEPMGARSEDHASWTESGKGGVSNGVGEDVVFNVGLYLDDVLVYSDSKTVASSGNGTSATFTPTLIIGETYRVVAYAEFGNQAETSVEAVNFKQALNDETADAYYVSEEVVAAPQLSAELTRAYGKLRLLADDWAEAERQFGSHIETITVNYKYGRPTEFNAKTGLFGEVDATSNLEMASKRVDYTGGTFTYKDETTGADVTETEGTDYKTIFVDYIPANDGDVMMPFSLTVTFADGDTYTRDFRQDIPVRRNWLTTLKGNLFTMGSELTLYIEENFDNEEVVEYDEDLAWVLANGGTYTLTEDLEIEKTLVVSEGANVVINLNGNDIINTSSSAELEEGDGIIVYGNLVLEGEGTVQGNTRAVWARGTTGAKVTIKGGTYIGALGGNKTEVIYASGDGVIDIYGGTFEAKTLDETSYAAPQYAVLNIQGNGKTGCDINVYGGVYVNFDPSNNVSENPKAGYHNSDFVAEGYKSVQKGDNYVVVADVIDSVVSTDQELIDALGNGDNVALANDITSNGPLAVNGGLLDGNGNTINANSGSAAYESGVNVSEGTLQNVVVSGAYRALGVGGSGAHKMTGDAYYKNVKTVGSTYGFNIGVGNNHWIYVEDCIVGDWNSYSGLAGATFTNCTFVSAGKYYASQRISAGATFTYKDCTFEQNVYDNEDGNDNYYLNSYQGTGTIVLDNCYLGDTKVTSENVNTLFQVSDVTVVVK